MNADSGGIAHIFLFLVVFGARKYVRTVMHISQRPLFIQTLNPLDVWDGFRFHV
jgi:hypothetical protein